MFQKFFKTWRSFRQRVSQIFCNISEEVIKFFWNSLDFSLSFYFWYFDFNCSCLICLALPLMIPFMGETDCWVIGFEFCLNIVVVYCDICSNTPLLSTFETLISTTDTLPLHCCWWQMSKSSDFFLLTIKCTQRIVLGYTWNCKNSSLPSSFPSFSTTFTSLNKVLSNIYSNHNSSQLLMQPYSSHF